MVLRFDGCAVIELSPELQPWAADPALCEKFGGWMMSAWLKALVILPSPVVSWLGMLPLRVPPREAVVSCTRTTLAPPPPPSANPAPPASAAAAAAAPTARSAAAYSCTLPHVPAPIEVDSWTEFVLIAEARVAYGFDSTTVLVAKDVNQFAEYRSAVAINTDLQSNHLSHSSLADRALHIIGNPSSPSPCSCVCDRSGGSCLCLCVWLGAYNPDATYHSGAMPSGHRYAVKLRTGLEQSASIRIDNLRLTGTGIAGVKSASRRHVLMRVVRSFASLCLRCSG
jgi:hypothetical protein